ncbi:MAG: HAMP domain-containing histidine kinase [Alphaproteobacteria bacterium]|nr:HAMP domain-containing histidine kinase [Alphaproteobacteria bacterium]
MAVGWLLLQLYEQSTAAQVGRAQAVAAHACDQIKDRYEFYVRGWTGPDAGTIDDRLRGDLTGAVGMALAQQNGVEGGIWQRQAGPLAYAFPTYQGTGPKTDVPAAELSQIKEINEQAEREDQTVERQSGASSQTLLLTACPLPGPLPALSAWTMSRVFLSPAFDQLRLGVGLLLAVMLAMSLWIMRILLVWSRHVRRIEEALAGTDPLIIATLRRTGERELDRIIDALNEAALRLRAAREEADGLTARVTVAERLAALGRVAAGVAHEIRNPIAALRLQGENALAGGDERRREAIPAMLAQVQRLDGLVSELLAMTQRREPRLVDLDVRSFLLNSIDPHSVAARSSNIMLNLICKPERASFDPDMVGRVLDNLLVNALRHTPPGGQIEIEAALRGANLVLSVSDNGPGVAPELEDQLFDPFVTGRADGTGLGLAIARELADAHGGTLRLEPKTGQGARFVLELPCGVSCRSS